MSKKIVKATYIFKKASRDDAGLPSSKLKVILECSLNVH